MSMSLYLSAIRMSRTALVTWAVILLAYSFIVAYLYDSFKDLTQLGSALEVMPEQVRTAMGLEGDVDFFAGGVLDINYFLNSEYLAWLPLMLAVFAVFYCGGIVSREAERGTLDLLLAQPLARTRLVLSKLATFLTMVGILLALSWLGILIGLTLIGVTVDFGRLLLAHFMIGPLVFAVSGYCTLFSCVSLDPRRSLALAGAVTAGMYILNFMAPTLGGFRWLENVSLFHHLNVFTILTLGTIDWTGLLVNLAVGAAALALTLIVFERRDLSY